VNAAIELHDSVLERLEPRPAALEIHFSHAYLHRSPGEPGVDPGTGWSQRAILAIRSGTVDGALPPLPADVADGRLRVPGTVHENCIPVPFEHGGAVELTLELSTGHVITVAGSKAALQLVGEPQFIEDFPGARD